MTVNVLLTGATGFIGQSVYSHLDSQKYNVRCALRQHTTDASITDSVIIDDIGPDTDWSESLQSIDIVIHLAGCAHQLGSSAVKNNYSFNQVNALGTRNLAQQAVEHKVKRFIYMSSVKVYGENIADNVILTETSQVGTDCDAYGLSKLAAEQHLMEVSDNTTMDFVIIRTPLVYGPGVGANFKSLIKLLATGTPLPFLAIENYRSMISLDNLVDFTVFCTMNEDAGNQIVLVSDGDDISLKRLVQTIRTALGMPTRLFRFPIGLLKLMVLLLGKSEQLAKLIHSFQINTDKANQQLGWKPVVTVDDSIIKTVKDYMKSSKC